MARRTSDQPKVASTLWRAVSDQTDKITFFDSSTSPNSFWIPQADLDLDESALVRKLTVAGGKVYSDNIADKFVPTPAFRSCPRTECDPELGVSSVRGTARVTLRQLW